MNSKISLIVAVDEERGMGKDNGIPWHISSDLKRFKALTTGHPVIMGRKTYATLGKPLPNRTNIVVTRDTEFKEEGVIVVHSLEQALRQAQAEQSSEIFIIGGGQIFAEAIKVADKLYLTIVHDVFDCDTFFPDYSEFKTTIFKEDHVENGLPFTYIDLQR